MPIGTVELVLGDFEYERAYLGAVATQAIQTQESLFVARFLTDLSLSHDVLSKWSDSGIELRQFGSSRHVNAYMQLADIGRVDIGMEESEVALRGGNYDVVVLSQILIALNEDLLTTADILSLIDTTPANVRLILTGCDAPAEIAAKCKLRKQGY
jgi:ATP:corrinoid adenosyltransferase